jgi:6-phospho-beta-glucosidase
MPCPDDAVVEVPTVIDAKGAHPLVTSQPALCQVGLMSIAKNVQRHLIRAAMLGQRAQAATGLALHPLVDSINVAKTLVDGYVEHVPGIAKVLVR